MERSRPEWCVENLKMDISVAQMAIATITTERYVLMDSDGKMFIECAPEGEQVVAFTFHPLMARHFDADEVERFNTAPMDKSTVKMVHIHDALRIWADSAVEGLHEYLN